jgi:hypothetical protein
MTPSPLAVEHVKRIRGLILELVNEGHQAQSPRLSDVMMWALLQRLNHEVSQNDVITVLQDLGDRGYLKFVQEKNRRTGIVTISQIQITPEGRDQLEGNDPPDPALHILR